MLDALIQDVWPVKLLLITALNVIKMIIGMIWTQPVNVMMVSTLEETFVINVKMDANYVTMLMTVLFALLMVIILFWMVTVFVTEDITLSMLLIVFNVLYQAAKIVIQPIHA